MVIKVFCFKPLGTENFWKAGQWSVKVVNLNIKKLWDLFNSTVQKYVSLLLSATWKEHCRCVRVQQGKTAEKPSQVCKTILGYWMV